MASSSLSTVRTRKGHTVTPQSEKAREDQILNAAGGYTFAVSDLDRVKRFLILGSETNYYTPGNKLAAQNAKVITDVVSTVEGAHAVVDLIVEYSTNGRAPKQDYGLFALAIAANPNVSADAPYALAALSKVARTATTLFQFVNYSLQFRGWGRSFKRAVAEWYTGKDVDTLAFQVTKYRNREGWTHRDLFRVSHPVPTSDEFKAVGEFILSGTVADNAPAIIKGYALAQKEDADLPALIREYGLSWEMLPTERLNDVKVWDALIDSNLPLTALIRQLPRLTNLGYFKPLEGGTSKVVARLTNKASIKKSRVHPLTILTALRTYQSGRGEHQTWSPSAKIVTALNRAFYLAFDNVVPTGKKYLIGLDVSGSMESRPMGGKLSAREITAAIASVLVNTEPEVHTIGFTGGSHWGRPLTQTTTSVTDLDKIIAPEKDLDYITRRVGELSFGSTDCALPMLYALEKGLRPDVFIVMTDNETWAGRIHPSEALEKYRRETGIDAKLIVLATEATASTITDPQDKNSLDIAGFDSAVPSLIAGFAKGEF